MTDPLDSIQVELGHGRTLTLARLLEGWEKHVRRLERELRQPVTELTWGAHDYFAALFLRDFISRGTELQGFEITRQVDERIAAVDALFREFTESDKRGLVTRFGEVTPSSNAWWWRRVPTQGLVRDELETWLTRSS